MTLDAVSDAQDTVTNRSATTRARRGVRPAPQLPPVIGDAALLRTGLPRQERKGEQLLRRLDGAEQVFAAISKPAPKVTGNPRITLEEFERFQVALDQVEPIARAYGTWSTANRRLLRDAFGVGADSIYEVVETPPFPERSSDDEFIPALRGAIRARISELNSVHALLGSASSTPTTGSDVSLQFLREVGIVEGPVIDNLEGRICNLRDRRNVRRVLGGAKELVEAVSLGALDALGETPRSTELPKLTKQTRLALVAALKARHPKAALVEESAARLAQGLSTIEQALSELRNKFGEGHGRAAAPQGLEVRHARLAIDAALAYVRYVVGALKDAGIR